MSTFRPSFLFFILFFSVTIAFYLFCLLWFFYSFLLSNHLKKDKIAFEDFLLLNVFTSLIEVKPSYDDLR